MQDLVFAKPCTYTAPNGEQRVFAPGVHRGVPDEMASNWFIQAHLAKEGGEPAAPETAPLTHEERVTMKAALDAMEGRAKGAEAERDAALLRVTALQEQLDAERLAHADTMALAETATAPANASGSGDATDTDEFAGKAYGIKRRGQGKFAVVKQDDASFAQDGLSKADALAKAREMNAAA